MINPVVGVHGYYGAFYHTALTTFLARINTYLGSEKYQRFRGLRTAMRVWQRAVARYPGLFAHWAQVTHRC
jgi:hypothetical protein